MYNVHSTGLIAMSEETERLVAEIPPELKELVDADKRTNKEIIEAALWREFGGERMGALERRIEEKQRRVSMIESEKNERERELKEEKQELEALKTKMEAEKNEQQAKLRQKLEQLETVPWEPDNPAIKSNAEDLDMEPKALITELEEYHAK